MRLPTTVRRRQWELREVRRPSRPADCYAHSFTRIGGQYVQYSFMSPVIHGGTAVIIDTQHNIATLDGDC